MVLQVVAGIICNRQGQILLGRRSGGRTLAGKWEFPGGKVEVGESLHQALQREILEELELLVEPQQALTAVHCAPAGISIQLIPMTAICTGGRLRLHAHSEVVWCAVERLDTYDLAAGDRAIVKRHGPAVLHFSLRCKGAQSTKNFDDTIFRS